MSSCRGSSLGTSRATSFVRFSSGSGNGELLRLAAAAGFQVFVAADQNLRFQQNLSGAPLAVIVLTAPSNALEDLLPSLARADGGDRRCAA